MTILEFDKDKIFPNYFLKVLFQNIPHMFIFHGTITL